MNLLKNIAVWIEDFAEFVQPVIRKTWQNIVSYYQVEAQSAWTDAHCPWPEAFIRELFTICARSDFVAESCSRYPAWLDAWSQADSVLYRVQSEAEFESLLRTQCSSYNQGQAITDETELMAALRVYRRAQMVRILWRDLLGLATLEQTLVEVSALADVCIRVALDWLYQSATERFGVPLAAGAGTLESQRLIVLGMGKLGARELNVSSDIDLIFAYPQVGMTDHPRKPIDNQQFFTRLCQRLIHVLDTVTGDGFVFRVDMRLRPYGDSGTLVLNFAALEDYYQNQGREWERYAMIKTRVLTGDPEQRKLIMAIIQPFVYRKYADFTSIQALRDMKRLIKSEIHRKGGDQNIKLGQGGIREVEFIVQACQLIYGGRDPSLQRPDLLPMFAVLKAEAYLPEAWLDQLLAAYRFLRRTEHAIQGLADQQTQLIPASSEQRQRVAWSLGYASWFDTVQVLQGHRDNVSAIFEDFLHDPEAEETQEIGSAIDWLHLWQAQGTEQDWLDALAEAHYEAPQDSYRLLLELKQSRVFGVMSADARTRFEQFLPLLLTVVAEERTPSKTLSRVLELVRTILGRTVYLVLLYENPRALRKLCHLCSESPWVSEHLAKSPVILDELINLDRLDQPPSTAQLLDELRQLLLRIPEDDLEAQMYCLRTFRQAHMLRVAAAEISGQLPLMKVSDYLTWLAEAILDQAVKIAWHNLVAKYGVPEGASGEHLQTAFAVIGYGKFGGIELGYSSDLDLVFIYDVDDQALTKGAKPINNQLFYTRLGQRVIHLLSAHTTQGDLYEVDMRLRPSGNSGMLVSSLAAFEKYQQQDAWTWEHQALVRARFIAGDPVLGGNFERVRRSILARVRDPQSLRAEVLGMRDKMKAAAIDELKSAELAADNMKQGEGGLIDIEFITQYGVLRYASEQPALLEWTDNIRLLETLAKYQCFPGVDVTPLIEAYRQLRSALHRQSLADKDYRCSLTDFPDTRRLVSAIWQQIFA